MRASSARRATPSAIATIIVSLLSASSALSQTKPPHSQSATTPAQRSLTGENKRHVDELEKQIAVLREEGRYAEAVALAQEVATKRSRAQGKNHPATAKARRHVEILEHMASLSDGDRAELAEADKLDSRIIALGRQGKYDDAITLVRQQLMTRERLLPEGHLDVASSVMALGLMLQKKGSYAEAEAMHRHVLMLIRQAPDSEPVDLATGLHNLAFVLLQQGDYSAAEALYRRALSTRRELLGDENLRVSHTLNGLGMTLFAMGNFDQARGPLEEALAIRRKVLENQAWVAEFVTVSLNNLALLHHKQGEYAAARSKYTEALTMKRRIWGNEHPSVATALCNLAALLKDEGDYDEAERLLGEALAIHRSVLGNRHPFVVSSLSAMASLLHARGDYTGAEAMWLDAAKSFEATRLRVSTAGLGRVRYAVERSPLVPLAACAARNGKPVLAWEHLEANLARGLLDSLSARHLRGLTHAEQTHEESLIRQLAQLDEQIALVVKSTDARGRAQVAELRQERDIVHAELARFEQELQKEHGVAAGRVYGLVDIQAQLAENAALLAWIDREGDPKAVEPGGEHWACVVRRHGDPRWVKLPGSGADGLWTRADGELPARVRSALNAQRPPRSQIQSLLDALRRQRITPIEQLLSREAEVEPLKQLIVLPAGKMASIPIEALTDRYLVSYAPSGTIYAWLRENRRDSTKTDRSERGGGLLALGDPVFSLTQEAPGSKHELDAVLAKTRGASYASLPGTRREVETISQLFEASIGGHSTTRLLGSDASEQRLAELATLSALKRFRFIHLATHGEMNDKVSMRSALILSRDRLPDAVDRVRAGQHVYDGRLTAEQIVRTWKLSADLVTVSACDSALGQMSGGEGFLGFSQAFFVSGARSLVLSLWKVDDTATALLMIRFYENLLGSRATTSPRRSDRFAPMSKVEALREAKRWLRGLTAEQTRNLCNTHELALPSTLARGEPGPMKPAETLDHPFEHPYYWSSFILLGSPD